MRAVERTAEFFLQEEPEIVASPRVRQQLPEAEGPALHTHPGGRFHAVTHTEEEESAEAFHRAGEEADSLGRVQGPVGDVIGQPGVARETAGEEGVVAAVGGAVLHDPGGHGSHMMGGGQEMRRTSPPVPID